MSGNELTQEQMIVMGSAAAVIAFASHYVEQGIANVTPGDMVIHAIQVMDAAGPDLLAHPNFEKANKMAQDVILSSLVNSLNLGPLDMI